MEAKDAFFMGESQPETSDSKSFCNEGLCTVVVNVKLTLDWINPPKDLNEEIRREQQQLLLDEKAYLMAKEIDSLFKENGANND